MTFRTQRLFCFLVVLLSGAGHAELRAQGITAAAAEPASSTAGGGANLLNSNLFGSFPVTYPALALRTSAGKVKMVNTGLNRANLSNYRPLMTDPVDFSRETKSLSTFSTPGKPAIREASVRHYIPSNNYYIQSGFFCKREWEMERSTHIPFRFRLGSLAQCNALEGK